MPMVDGADSLELCSDISSNVLCRAVCPRFCLNCRYRWLNPFCLSPGPTSRPPATSCSSAWGAGASAAPVPEHTAGPISRRWRDPPRARARPKPPQDNLQIVLATYSQLLTEPNLGWFRRQSPGLGLATG